MRVIAPGKVLLTGAYAVLEGAPAIVLAVDRYAVADEARVDTSALYHSGTKLGLGSSAAALVASLGREAALLGADLAAPPARDALFLEARDAHAREQRGGSGVDVAASVFGGALRYELAPNRREGARVRPVTLPAGLEVAVYWSGTSARTSDLRARVDALRARSASTYQARFAALSDAARAAAIAIDEGDRQAFLAASRMFADALAALGAAADAPIVPPSFAELGAVAADAGAVFFPSGAGGGDVGVFLGHAAPSAAFGARAERLEMKPLSLGIDHGGVRALRAGRSLPQTA